jgi:hypothetical protein
MKFLVVAIFSLSYLPCLSAPKEKERTCRIIFLQRPVDAPREVHLFDGEASRKVALPGMNFSEVVKLPPGNISLGMTPDAVAAPEDFPKDAPTARIPEGITDFYLIVVSDPENKILPVRMLPVDAGDQQLKAGQTLWINLTTDAIAGKLGNETLRVPPGKRVVGKAPMSASGYYKAAFAYQPGGEGEYLPIMKKSWWFDANSKSLGFIIASGGRLPRIFTFRDRRIPEKSENSE